MDQELTLAERIERALHPPEPTNVCEKDPVEIDGMKVHPVTAMFPWLPTVQMESMVKSIQKHGLLDPIVLNKDGVLLDGKIRLRACKLAGVEPRFTTYEGDDPEAFILSMNVFRMHFPPDVRAMAIALRCDPDEPTDERLEMARKVIRECGEDSLEVSVVLKGQGTLKEVHNIIVQRQQLYEKIKKLMPDVTVPAQEEEP
jgi:ParB/Sulfiredoxin domain